MAAYDALKERLGVAFANPALLQQALVHSSYVNENLQTATQSNERLEFLGDAVLGLVVADEIFALHPNLDEGALTQLRTHLVRRDTLANAARRLGLGSALLLGRGEESGGGRERSTILSCAYEAVVGAVFLDGGLASARDFVLHSLSEEFQRLAGRAVPADPKSRLQEITQARHQSTPLYRLVNAEGPDHARRFTVEVLVNGRVLGRGTGGSKQQAEKEAARQALMQVEASPPAEPTGMSDACT